ncbi:MAG: SNF2-related protein [Acidimicrobiales bacterium]
MEDIDTIEPSWEATFVPLDPPRASYFALWDPADVGGLPMARSDSRYKPIDVALVVPFGSGPLRTAVAARRLPIRDAIEVLGGRSVRQESTRSVTVWGAILRSGLGLVARGRLLPWVSANGWDAWRVDPLDPADHQLVAQLADALPAIGHCVPSAVGPVAGRETIVDPSFAIRACYDAIADRMVRSSGAAAVASSPLFAQLEPTRVPHLRPWVSDIATEHCAAAVFTVTVDPPDELVITEANIDQDSPLDPTAPPVPPPEPIDPGRQHWTLRFQLRSRQDPSLLVDAANLWNTPAEVLRLLGDQAEIDLLAGLRRAAAISPLFATSIDDARPTEVDFGDDDLDDFLDSLDALAEAGIEVRWPASLVAPSLDRRLVATSAAKGGGPAIGSLDDLLTVNWEYLLDGLALTADELEVLSFAKRSVVPIRGRWVRIDAALRQRLRQPPPQLTIGETMAAGLAGSWNDPDAGDAAEPVELRIEGDLAEVLASLSPSGVGAMAEAGEPPGLCATLRPYQRQGLAWMSNLAANHLGGVLADDMGLGKTVQILALHAQRGGPTLVVCPTSLMANWEREARRFVPSCRVRRYHGAGRRLRSLQPGDIVITTYGVVRSDAEHLATLPFDLVVADEAQQIKNARSRSARAMRMLRSNVRFAVTGTPIENQLTELWALIDFAIPGLLGPLDRFRRDVALPIERDNDRSATVRLAKATAPFLLRRRKTDPGIAPELPAKIERNVIVPLTAEQASLYRATTEEVLADVQANEGLVRQGMVLKLLTALKQITNHPAHYLGQSGPLVDRSGKLDALDNLLDAAATNGEATLVFTQYVAMAELLAAHLDDRGIEAGLLHGGLSPVARQCLVDRFQAGDLGVLLLSLRAGGTGLNLTRATQVIHYDRWWNPAVEDQATDRAYRIGQDRAVTVHRLITEGTVEDRVAALLEAKRELADRVIGNGSSWFAKLDDDALATLVRLEGM